MKRKRLLKSIVAFGTCGLISAGTIATLSSCSLSGSMPGHYVRSGGKVFLVTDSGSINDHSFNEAALDGTAAWTSQGDSKRTYSYIIPEDVRKDHLQLAYKAAVKDGAETLVLPGFNHGVFGTGNIGTLNPAKPGFESDPLFTSHKTNFLAIDCPNISKKNRVHALNFKTSESAYLAAVYTGIYMNEKNLVIGNELKVAGYGGIAMGAVTAYLDGWLQGVAEFNNLVKASQDPTVKTWKPMKQIFANGSQFPTTAEITNSFAPGIAAVNLSKAYIQAGAQVIMSVAGAQTGNTVTAIKEHEQNNPSTKGKLFVIGPDTDQSLVFDPNIVLGTAVKGIAAATIDGLNRIYGINGASFGNTPNIDYVYNSKKIAGTPPPVNIADLGKETVGFLPSKAELTGSKAADTAAVFKSDIYTKALQVVWNDRTDAETIFDSNYTQGGGKGMEKHLDKIQGVSTKYYSWLEPSGDFYE